MVVYVDDELRAEIRKRPRGRVVDGQWSQLLADTTGQLLTAATGLGVCRSWVQHAGTPSEHVEVTADQRHHAITAGALPITTGERAHLVAAKRAGIVFDLAQHRAHPDWYASLLTRTHTPPLTRTHTPPPVPACHAAGVRRVRLPRTRGLTLPAGTVSVVAPTRWATPYPPAGRTPAAYQAATDRFAEYLARNPALVDQARPELAGHHLGCWCPLTLPCHADVWLTVVNPTDGTHPTVPAGRTGRTP